ncbi:MAG TPA: helix-hairpin-helix domain-containing protein [Cyclobacteriaceae bacterium]
MSKEDFNLLDVTVAEKKGLRVHKIKIKEMHHHSIASLQQLLNTSKIRAMELYALSEFQSLPSIGIRFSQDLISMGFYSLKDLKKKDGAQLTDQFEAQSGVWIDSCVEDQFRLVVHYANHPDSKLNWWDFTKERKAFREKSGYPSSRPKQPWFELPQFQTSSNIKAANEDTKKELHKKLKRSINYMKKHFNEKINVSQLADQAHLSIYHYIRCFKSAYEVTPLQYLTQLRLKNASLLLKQSKLELSHIIPQCGFEDESSFIRLFRKEFRLTPIAYRKTFASRK